MAARKAAVGSCSGRTEPTSLGAPQNVSSHTKCSFGNPQSSQQCSSTTPRVQKPGEIHTKMPPAPGAAWPLLQTSWLGSLVPTREPDRSRLPPHPSGHWKRSCSGLDLEAVASCHVTCRIRCRNWSEACQPIKKSPRTGTDKACPHLSNMIV